MRDQCAAYYGLLECDTLHTRRYLAMSSRHRQCDHTTRYKVLDDRKLQPYTCSCFRV